MRAVQFINTALAAAAIAAMSWLSAKALPDHAWECGWVGAAVYFILVVRR